MHNFTGRLAFHSAVSPLAFPLLQRRKYTWVLDMFALDCAFSEFLCFPHIVTVIHIESIWKYAQGLDVI
ncbi:hypothetical protein SUGI_0955850 [Cryptomeria japonica]|nr:hypothetical protein SUGI_0955850 [Cryptomeria japonica]